MFTLFLFYRETHIIFKRYKLSPHRLWVCAAAVHIMLYFICIYLIFFFFFS